MHFGCPCGLPSIEKEWRLLQRFDFLLYGAGQLLTCSCNGKGPKRGKSLSDAGIIANGALAAHEGRIIAVGSMSDVERAIASASASVELDAGGRVVLPGWVDSHTHAVFSRYRADEYEARIRGDSYLEIERRGGGIMRTVREVRDMSEERLYEVSKRRLSKIIQQGTTTIEIKSGYGLDVENELKMLRVAKRLGEELQIEVVPTFMGAHQKPPERSRPGEYVSYLMEEMIPAVSREKLAEFVDVFCEEGVFSLDETEKILFRARSSGFKLKVHADEITPLGGTELAVRLGAVSADHLAMISSAGIAAISASDTIAVLLPGTTFGLGLRDFAPARDLVAHGAAVALATDYNPGSAPSFSMPFVLSLACSQMRLTPAEAINAATINAAFAVGRGSIVGSLEVGKRADLVVYDVGDYREIPSRPGTSQAVKVVKAGSVIFEKTSFEDSSEVGF